MIYSFLAHHGKTFDNLISINTLKTRNFLTCQAISFEMAFFQESLAIILQQIWIFSSPNQCTEVRFVSFFSGGFITAIIVNPPERKLEKHTSVQCIIYASGVRI